MNYGNTKSLIKSLEILCKLSYGAIADFLSCSKNTISANSRKIAWVLEFTVIL